MGRIGNLVVVIVVVVLSRVDARGGFGFYICARWLAFFCGMCSRGSHHGYMKSQINSDHKKTTLFVHVSYAGSERVLWD